MSVSIASAGSPEDFSAAKKREIVLEYGQAPWGQKRDVLDKYGVTIHSIKKWRKLAVIGGLDRPPVPRKNVSMDEFAAAEIARLKAERIQLLDQIAAMQEQLRQGEERDLHRIRAIDAMGKAIAIMQKNIED